MRRLLLPLLALLLLPACKSKPGDSCSGTEETCADEQTKLYCRSGIYAAIRCEGPKGCKAEGDKAKCDFSGNKPGSDCEKALLGQRVCKGKNASIACRDKFVQLECRGPEGCVPADDSPGATVKVCDTSIAKEGDLCDRTYTTKPACDADGKKLLECGKEGKFEFVRHCRGPEGCKSVKGEAVCDGSVQVVDDPCVPPVPESCSPDGLAVLLCDGHKIFEKMCPGPYGCRMGESGVLCDMAVPRENNPCDKKGFQACQKGGDKDPMKLLECDGKKFRVAKKCPGGCTFTRPSTFECK